MVTVRSLNHFFTIIYPYNTIFAGGLFAGKNVLNDNNK